MNIAYELVNKPWRARVILRAIRFGKLRQQREVDDTIEWFAALARETRKARMLQMYGGELQPWQLDMLANALESTGCAITLHTTDPGLKGARGMVSAMPYQHPMRGPVTWSTADGSSPIVFDVPNEPATITHVGLYAAQGEYDGVRVVTPEDDNVPPWVRRAFGWDDEL